MTSDALFQLGMGPVESFDLDAAQTEDLCKPRAAEARKAGLRARAADAAFLTPGPARLSPAARFPSRYRACAPEIPTNPR